GRGRGEVYAKTQSEMERAALTALALAPHLSPHELHQLRADGQSKPRPPILTRGRAVRLGKSLEDTLLFISRDANARVSDRDVEEDGALHDCLTRAVMGRLICSQRYIDYHLALGREF